MEWKMNRRINIGQWVAALTLGVLLSGCIATERGTTNQLFCYPYDEEVTVLDEDEPSAVGFSANEVLAQIGEQHSGSLKWRGDDASVPLSLTVSIDSQSEIRHITRTTEETETDPDEEWTACEPDGQYLEIPLVYQLSTEDGSIDERWAFTIEAADVNGSSLRGYPFPAQTLFTASDEVQGTMPTEGFEGFVFSVQVVPSFTGTLEGHNLIVGEPCGTDCTPSAMPQRTLLASW